jgi:hypothetical protein
MVMVLENKWVMFPHAGAMDNMLRQPFTMIKIIFLFLSAITLFNCQSSNINNITYDKKDYVLTSLEQKLDLKDTVIGIFFEGNFSGNFTKIYFDQDLLFDKKITSNLHSCKSA